jgi:hypothetical protein
MYRVLCVENIYEKRSIGIIRLLCSETNHRIDSLVPRFLYVHNWYSSIYTMYCTNCRIIRSVMGNSKLLVITVIRSTVHSLMISYRLWPFFYYLDNIPLERSYASILVYLFLPRFAGSNEASTAWSLPTSFNSKNSSENLYPESCFSSK